MKLSSAFSRTTFAVILATSLIVHLVHADEMTGAVDIDKLMPGDRKGERVSVELTRPLLSIAAAFARQQEPEAAQLIDSLKLIRVRVGQFGEEGKAQAKESFTAARKTIEAAGWQKVVSVQDKDDDAAVHLKMRGEEAIEGLLVTVISGDREAVVVNIVGNLKPEQLAKLGARLNIEPMKKAGELFEKKDGK